MLALLLRALAHLPLRIVQTIGIGMGWIIYWASSQYRQTLKDNIRQSALYHSHTDYTRLIRASIVHQGIAGMELPYMWCHSLPHLVKLIRQTTGMHYIEQALTQDAPLVFVLPHLGCIDICGLYLSASLPRPTTAMYRPPKIKSLEPLMKKGRDRHTGATTPANIAGVRTLVRALKNKEAIIILPDQAPTAGEGVWAPFFGRSAYTMTLLPRLVQKTGATVLMCFAKRLPKAQGFHMHILPLDQPFGAEQTENAVILNRNIEHLIALAPEQYLWSYNRYKRAAGAPPIRDEI